MDTVMTQVQRMRDDLKETLHGVNVLEKTLSKKLLPADTREKLEKDLENLKSDVKRVEKELEKLTKENTKSFAVSACLVFLCFLAYGVYIMFFRQTIT